MKKILAMLLAVITVFSFGTFSAAAEDTTETETTEAPFTGVLYEYNSKGVPRINGNTEGDVIIFQPGDRFQFEKITAKTKSVEVVYYPDVASIKKTNIKNANWLQKYTDDGFEAIQEAGTFAVSPNKYKSFYTITDAFVKNDVPVTDIIGFGDLAATRDAAGVDRGDAVIDYELSGAKFVGWALYKYTWSKSSTSKAVLELYAVWDRTAGTDTPGESEGPEGPVVDADASPIKQALDTLIYYIDFVGNWIKAVPALLNTFFSMFISTKLKPWLYEIFGIEDK